MQSEKGTLTVAQSATVSRVRSVTVHVTKGPDAGRSVTIEQPSFVIGVGEAADFRLTDPGVSREHIRLTLQLHGVRVKDPGSKNGTFLGGARIHEVTLTSDTAITIGGTTLGISVSHESMDLQLSANDRFGDAIGSSAIMRHLFNILEKVAGSDLTILLEGESGVGKDVLARAIHGKSARKDGPFAVADCSAIPENLIESELFGHERGAFTGADQARKGVFEEANGGTLFLDEIGELPLDMQPKLLRALEAREVRPVGGRAPRPIDVRVIAATNRRLAESARTGEFRSDLFYRLAVVKVTVPPLRERAEDILPIARAMFRALKHDPLAEIPADFAAMLKAYSWPGNVRELRNVMERHAALGEKEGLFDHAKAVEMSADDELAMLPYHEARKLVVDRFEEQYVPRLLKRAENNLSRAADLANIARPSLYRMLERVGYQKKQ
ncbi:MAG: sigma 54-dependent Fis family transcriptional regulator [Labilithrix sp.]|nr:sigma 54-dependent Fis family transcriptional regulator [Labilithrix sp.]MCW5817109.1 sigma 54-dependent Fis family transcriptional regulator [Labilithrix sp.]